MKFSISARRASKWPLRVGWEAVTAGGENEAKAALVGPAFQGGGTDTEKPRCLGACYEVHDSIFFRLFFLIAKET